MADSQNVLEGRRLSSALRRPLSLITIVVRRQPSVARWNLAKPLIVHIIKSIQRCTVKQSYKDLRVWKKSMTLVEDVYKLTGDFPKEELYGLTSQMRRAAVSVPSNIAEGKGRHTNAEFRQFLIQARGSLLELETQIQIAENLGFLNPSKSDELKSTSSDVGKMLNGLIEAMN